MPTNTPRFESMPWIKLGESDPAASMTAPPVFPDNISPDQRASLRFKVTGNAVCTFLPPTLEPS